MDIEESLDPAENETELFSLYRETGDPQYRDTIFSRYLKIVDLVSRSYVRAGVAEKDDLLQVGYLGLLGAIERFDTSRNVRFATYANHCVDGEIRHFLRDKTESIRRPRWMRQLSRQVAMYLESYLQEHASLPNLKEISEALNVSEEGIVEILKVKQPLSLEDERHGHQLSSGSIKSLRHVSFQLPIEDRIAMSQAFERLIVLEQKVVFLFFVRDLTQKQIAGELSLSPRKVSRLMSKALARLRGMLDPEEPSDVKRK